MLHRVLGSLQHRSIQLVCADTLVHIIIWVDGQMMHHICWNTKGRGPLISSASCFHTHDRSKHGPQMYMPHVCATRRRQAFLLAAIKWEAILWFFHLDRPLTTTAHVQYWVGRHRHTQLCTCTLLLVSWFVSVLPDFLVHPIPHGKPPVPTLKSLSTLRVLRASHHLSQPHYDRALYLCRSLMCIYKHVLPFKKNMYWHFKKNTYCINSSLALYLCRTQRR
jgi:hypothetical protein